MVVESLVAEALCHVQLMGIPQLSEYLLDVVLVHAEVHKMDLGAWLTDESAMCDVSVSRLPLVAVDAVGVELVVGDESDHQSAKLITLALLEQLHAHWRTSHGLLDGSGSVRIRCLGGWLTLNRVVRLFRLLLLLQIFSCDQADALEVVVVR